MKRFKPGRDNKGDRMNFVDYWAEYVRTHDDIDWSEQQRVLVDSQIQNARKIKLSTKDYLESKRGK